MILTSTVREDLPLGNRHVVVAAIETSRDGHAAHYLQIVLNYHSDSGNGKLSSPNIVQVDVTSLSSYPLVLPSMSGNYYCMLVAVGCSGTQMMVSSVQSLSVVVL